jgi:isoprenylcysteine carboxyl methyltransferase (ICMT) family protein YpbQ
LSGLIFSGANLMVLRERIRVEERALAHYAVRERL